MIRGDVDAAILALIAAHPGRVGVGADDLAAMDDRTKWAFLEDLHRCLGIERVPRCTCDGGDIGRRLSSGSAGSSASSTPVPE